MPKLLLDTHTFLWWMGGIDELSRAARLAIGQASNSVFVSSASAWEIATKVRIGKLPGAATIAPDLTAVLDDQGFVPLPITIRHGQAGAALPGPLRDPFDRMLIAQAILEGMVLVSNERAFDGYGVSRLW